MKRVFKTLLTLVFAQWLFTAPTYAGNLPDQGSNQETVQLQSALININTANEAALRSLPGIGISKAKAIIEYRETYGEFSSVAEITNVKGIGNKLLEKLERLIDV